MKKKQGIQRKPADLIRRLVDHLELLVELSDKAFYEHQYEKYLGEVAGKLRLLVIETRTNKPLLIGLMDHFNYEREWESQTPGIVFTLRTYMYMLAIANGGYEFSNEKTIRFLSQQSGGSHEDWELDAGLHFLLYEDRTRSCDSPYINRLMRNYTNIVLLEAGLFLWYLHKNGTLKELGVQLSIRQILSLYKYYNVELDWSPANRKKKGIYNRSKPRRVWLEQYDIMYLCGRADNFFLKITGLTNPEVFKSIGPKKAMWMVKEKYMYRMKESDNYN